MRNLEARAMSRVGETVPCGVCGEGFLVVYPGTLYCSDKCRLGRERRRGAERWDRETKGLRKYTPRRRAPSECRTCGASFLADSSQRYCSIRCRPSCDKSSSKRKLLYLIKRDGGRCKLCGRKVNLKARAPHPESPCVDHIVPRSKGGGNERANLQLAHWLCNSKKAAKGCGSQLQLLG